MDFKALIVQAADGVAWITLNRPEMLNAFDPELREELIAAFDRIRSDPAIRVVVLTGAGKGFCTGAALGGEPGGGPTGPGATRELMRMSSQRIIKTVWELEKPVIAAVNGVAAGLGAHLAFACDLIVAAEEARFIEVFVRRGIAVDAAGAYLLPRLVGLTKAKELVFFGDDLPAREAERIGIVNKVVPAAELVATARAWAERLARGPTFALGLSKRMLNRSLDSDLETCLELEGFAQTLVTHTDDLKEGMLAFKERREPRFSGR